MIDAAERGEIRALYIVGENPIRSLPQKKVREAFSKLDLLICQELFLTETAAEADVVFPAASFAEKEGRYTNSEGEIQKVRKAIDPIGTSKPDRVIFSLLAEKMGSPLVYKTSDDIWKEIVMTMPSGWPHPSLEGMVSHITAYCGQLRPFVTPPPPAVGAPTASNGAKGTFHLQVGQILYHSGKMSTYADGLNAIFSKEALFIHPDDAEQMGIAEGELIDLTYPAKVGGGRIQVPVAFSKRLSRRTLFFPEHFSLEIKKGLPLQIDPVTQVPYSNSGIVLLSKAAVAVS